MKMIPNSFQNYPSDKSIHQHTKIEICSLSIKITQYIYYDSENLLIIKKTPSIPLQSRLNNFKEIFAKFIFANILLKPTFAVKEVILENITATPQS